MTKYLAALLIALALALASCERVNHDDTIHYVLGSDSYFIKTDSAVYIYNKEGVIQSVTPLTKKDLK